MLSKLVSIGLKGALAALLGGPPVERAVRKATAAALLETIQALAPEAGEDETRRVQDVLNQCRPKLDFSPEGSGSLLDSVEFMVKTTMATTTEPVRLGAALAPTTVLDTIEEETGIRVDADEFAREFIHRSSSGSAGDRSRIRQSPRWPASSTRICRAAKPGSGQRPPSSGSSSTPIGRQCLRRAR